MTCSHAFSSALDAPVTPFFRARSHASCSRTAQAPITLHRAQMRKTRKELKAKVIIFTAQSSTLSQLLTPFCLGAEHLRSKETRLFREMKKKKIHPPTILHILSYSCFHFIVKGNSLNEHRMEKKTAQDV